MFDRFKILTATLVLAGALQAPAAQAAYGKLGAEPAKTAALLPTKPLAKTCKGSWPYVVLICVA